MADAQSKRVDIEIGERRRPRRGSGLEGEPVDFCFLYDRDYEVLRHGLVMSSDTCWIEVKFTNLSPQAV